MAQDRKIHIDLEITRCDGRRAVLTLETGKQYYGVGSEAQVGWEDNRGFRQIALGLGGGGDYNRKVAKVEGAATQKRIDTLHAQTFTPEMVAEITEQAKAWSQRIADREAEQAAERAAGRNSNPMGAALKELTDSGIDASTALRMLNID